MWGAHVALTELVVIEIDNEWRTTSAQPVAPTDSCGIIIVTVWVAAARRTTSSVNPVPCTRARPHACRCKCSAAIIAATLSIAASQQQSTALTIGSNSWLSNVGSATYLHLLRSHPRSSALHRTGNGVLGL